MSETAVVVNTAVAILAVVVMIVRFKLNPVVSLVVGSAYLGLAVGLGVEGTIDAITGGFGEIMAEVGLLIAFGVLMGAILQQTGFSDWSKCCCGYSARNGCPTRCR